MRLHYRLVLLVAFTDLNLRDLIMDNYICLERESMRIKAFSPQACRSFSLHHFPSGSEKQITNCARSHWWKGVDLMLDNQEANGNYTVLSFSLVVLGGDIVRHSSLLPICPDFPSLKWIFSYVNASEALLYLFPELVIDVDMSLFHFLPAGGAFDPSNAHSVSGP